MTPAKLPFRALVGALLPLVGLGAFAPSVTYGFTLDDAYTVAGHPGVTGPLAFDDLVLRDFWGRSFANTIGSWRPTASLALWASWHAGSGRPWAFHVANLVFEGVLLVVADAFLARFFGEALSRGARFAAVVTFGVLAIHADVVPSATGCAEILAALFALLSLLVLLRRDGPPSVVAAFLSAGATGLAIGAKESALPIAILVPVLAFRWHARRGTARGQGLFALTLANALVFLAVVAFRVLRMPFMAPGPERAMENPLITASALARIAGAGEVLVRYVAHAAWPSRLAPDYSYAALVPGHAPALAALGLAGAVALAFVAWRARARLGVTDAMLGFAASYVVVSHALVPAIAVMADRLFFFPSFWLVTFAALVVDDAVRRAGARSGAATRRVVAAAVVVFVGGQTIIAVRDCAHWRDDATLLTAAVRARPTAARSRRNLAQLLGDAGQSEAAAWQLTVSMAILTHAPDALGADAYPASCEDEPLPARLEALRTRDGDASFRRDLALAAATFRRWGSDDPARVVDGWAVHLAP